jgi:threonine/homoserine/homoserine lactone efflux protein
MEPALLGTLFGLAAVDALNPSAIVATVVLLGTTRPVGRVLAYVAGIFTVYFTVAIALTFGLSGIIGSLVAIAMEAFIALPWPFYLGQAIIAALMLVLGLRVLRRRAAGAARNDDETARRGATIWGAFLLGGSITLVEATTAAPLIAAVGIVGQSGLPWPPIVAVLAAYCAVFVSIPLAILASFIVVRERIAPVVDAVAGRLPALMQRAFAAILLVLGVTLLADAAGFAVGMPLLPA